MSASLIFFFILRSIFLPKTSSNVETIIPEYSEGRLAEWKATMPDYAMAHHRASGRAMEKRGYLLFNHQLPPPGDIHPQE